MKKCEFRYPNFKQFYVKSINFELLVKRLTDILNGFVAYEKVLVKIYFFQMFPMALANYVDTFVLQIAFI